MIKVFVLVHLCTTLAYVVTVMLQLMSRPLMVSVVGGVRGITVVMQQLMASFSSHWLLPRCPLNWSPMVYITLMVNTHADGITLIPHGKGANFWFRTQPTSTHSHPCLWKLQLEGLVMWQNRMNGLSALSTLYWSSNTSFYQLLLSQRVFWGLIDH